MAVALAYPEPEKGGRGQKSFILKGFAESNLSYARTVIKHAPDIGENNKRQKCLLLARVELDRRFLLSASGPSGLQPSLGQERIAGSVYSERMKDPWQLGNGGDFRDLNFRFLRLKPLVTESLFSGKRATECHTVC
jgi:hypothetical protein